MATRSRPRLRLRRDDGDAAAELPRSFPFPRNAAARRRLIAATVDVPATPDDDLDTGHTAVIGRIGPDEFLRGVEAVLDDMQRRIDSLKSDVADCFKFPTPRGDDDYTPRAA